MKHLRPMTGLCVFASALGVSAPSALSATTSFQDGTLGYSGTVDTMLRQAAPTTAYTTTTSIGWDTDDPSGTGNYNYVLIRFDNIFGSAAGQIPVNSVVTSASLTYYVSNTGAVGNVNEAAVDWSESVTYNTFGGDAGVQADEYGAARGSATGTAGTNTVDVTASLAAWSSNPAANRGWIIRPTGTDGVDFYTREWTTSAQRPKLTVTYTPSNTIGISPGSISTVVGKADITVTVSIPSGSNASVPVQVTLTTNSAAVAIPVGATGNSLTLTFPQGGSTTQNVNIDIGSAGSANIVTTNDAGLTNTSLPISVSNGTITFDPPFVAMPLGTIPVTVSLSAGSNETRSVQVTLTSSNPAVAIPVGASGGSLTLTFAAGASTQQTVNIQTLQAGDTAIVSTNNEGLTNSTLNTHAIVGFNFTLTADPRTVVSEWQIVMAGIKTKLGGIGAFHITAGDLDPPTPLRTVVDTQFGASALWYPCVGNHEAETADDMTWIRSEYTNGNGMRTPLKNFTNQDGPAGSMETMYSWDYGIAHFVMLNEYWNGGTATGSDVALDGDIVQAMYDWLAADLAANTKPAVFIIGHEPAYPFNRHVGDSLDQYPANRDAFWTLLEAEGVHAYLCGHTHVYSKYQKTANSTWQIDAGTAGNDDPPRTFVNILVSSTAVEYYVWSNGSGTFQLAESWSAPVNSCISATITQQPSNQFVCRTSAAQFTVGATGDGPLSYQWQKNGTNLANNSKYSGVDTATLQITNVSPSEVGSYRCIVTGPCNSITSDSATLTLRNATGITQQPTAKTICEGSTTTFTAAGSGDGTLTYQWQKNSVNLSNGGHYSGVTTTTLTVSSANADDAASYRCVITGGCGSATTNQALLTVKAATIITQQPTNQSVAGGGNAQFSVDAMGDGTLSYQWKKDGVDLGDAGHVSGSTTATLTITGADATDAGSYNCVVTAGCGSTTSSAASLTISGPTCNTPKMDTNGDLHVDATDFDAFSACYNGPTNKVSGDCLCLDDNGDEYVDATDFDAFSSCYNGPANPPGCG